MLPKDQFLAKVKEYPPDETGKTLGCELELI